MNEPITAKVIVDLFYIRAIEGRILTIVESIGMPQKQEDAVKGLIRQAIWEDLNRAQYIFEHQYARVYKFLNDLMPVATGSTSSDEKVKPD